jgi:alpha-galactosidase
MLSRFIDFALIGLAFTLIVISSPVVALSNGAAMHPPKGWSTWCGVGGCGSDRCTEDEILETARAVSLNGLQKLGYTMIMLDDCWAAPWRDAEGLLTWDPVRFPNGIPYLVSTLHQSGFNVSLYTSIGDTTCDNGGRNGSIPGSAGKYQLDVNTFARWGVDGIIADCCGSCRNKNFSAAAGYINFTEAVLNANPPVAMYLQGDAALQYLLWDVGEFYNAWQAFSDHHDHWSSTFETIAMMETVSVKGRPGAWSYMDVLMTGGQGCPMEKKASIYSAHCPGQTDIEYRTEFTMWSINQSPLIVGTDVRNMTLVMNATLFNEALLAIHYDTTTPPGELIGLDSNCTLTCGPENLQLILGPLKVLSMAMV